eukprot:4695781-Alexandrium_andersonii.AAC.1
MRKANRKVKRSEDRRRKRDIEAGFRAIASRDHEFQGRGTLVRGKYGYPTLIPKRGRQVFEEHPIPPARQMVMDRVPYDKVVKVGALNVRSLVKATMQRQVTLYMEQNGLDLLALQETRIPTTSQFTSGEFLFILFGSGAAKEYAGV